MRDGDVFLIGDEEWLGKSSGQRDDGFYHDFDAVFPVGNLKGIVAHKDTTMQFLVPKEFME